MDAGESDAVERVRNVFERIVADGLRREAVSGASDELIDEMARSQEVAAVPAAVREVLRLVGGQPGIWLMGSSFGPKRVGAQAKRNALATLRQKTSDPLTDAAGMLVLLEHQAYAYHVIDGVDLSEPDPAVWAIVEGEDVGKMWPSVSAWFGSTAPDVSRFRQRLKLMREVGREREPSWAQHIRL
ncbi:hypothetical protein [Actinomadura fibrosa]|uniref:Uncharacterized protein n=1 Tax=Actinomadura fibrosa TaxID=111802 RepID=A0ABW2Y0U4_9ACTN|nr:hypothetical protein [Actinomadura fibrosa]